MDGAVSCPQSAVSPATAALRIVRPAKETTDMRIERTIEISAERSAVWRVLADLENVADWNPTVVSVSCGSGPAGLGSTRTCSFAFGGHIDEVVSEWEPGHRLQFAVGSHGGIRSADMATVLADSPGGTRTMATVDYHLAFGPLGPVIDRIAVRRQIGRMLEVSLAGLREHVEQ